MDAVNVENVKGENNFEKYINSARYKVILIYVQIVLNKNVQML